MRTSKQVDELVLKVRRGYDATAPAEVRKCCENYDTKHGCLFREKCTAPKCRHYQEVVLKVASIEGVLSRQKAASVGGAVRVCPDCGQIPLKARQRVCKTCGDKRLRAAYRRYRVKKTVA
jgi:hypothetical protein